MAENIAVFCRLVQPVDTQCDMLVSHVCGIKRSATVLQRASRYLAFSVPLRRNERLNVLRLTAKRIPKSAPSRKNGCFSFRAGRSIVMCIALRIGLFFYFNGKQSVKSVTFYLLSYVMLRAGFVPSGDAAIQL